MTTTILQSEASECGLACLANILEHFDHGVPMSELRRRFSGSLRGSTLRTLVEHADALGLQARAVRLELDALRNLSVPSILHWRLNHFVVLVSVSAKYLVILDPAVGRRRISIAEASECFTGFALEVVSGPTGPKQGSPKSWFSISESTQGFKGALLHILALAVTLECLAVLSPLLGQLVLDKAVSTYDLDLLHLIMIGFAGLTCIQALITLARSWTIAYVSQRWAFRWTTRIFRHLLALPAAYFERRHTGDVLSRFHSGQIIQSTLSTQLIETVLDGAMSAFALGLMLLYSAKLTVIVVVTVLIATAIRAGVYSRYKAIADEQLQASAKEQSHFLETVRGILTIKLYGAEDQRSSVWQNLFNRELNRSVKLQKLTALTTTANASLFSLQIILVYWFGAELLMSERNGVGTSGFTIGMLFAFFNYQSQFATRAFGLMENIFQLRMLRLHIDRLGDITQAEVEPRNETASDLPEGNHCIELRDVGFRYGANDPWLFRGLNARLSTGGSYAIAGPSGCGKTTLAKLMLGLLDPTEGSITYGGQDIKKMSVMQFRKIIGTVMQDDVLLAGSIAANITFFQDDVDQERMVECCRQASVHDEIVRMPMGYQTLVGDMGSSLSGGQKQRILMARALYKNPRILIFDEATSHLDVSNERAVNTAISKMQLTRIIIAHRPETIASADHVITLGEVGASRIKVAA